MLEQTSSELRSSAYMTIPEVARKFNVSPDTVRRYLRAGKLRDIKWVRIIGRNLHATRESVERFEARKTR